MSVGHFSSRSFCVADEQIAVVITKKLTDAFQAFASGMLNQSGLNPSLAQFPVLVYLSPFSFKLNAESDYAQKSIQ